MIERKRVVYIPYPVRGNKINDLLTNLVNILSKRYTVCGELTNPADIVGMLETKAVFLNWIEEKLDKKMKFQLLLYRLLGAKIVWVFHNRLPHDMKPDSRAAENMKWLADRCSIIWILSRHSRRYIPNRERNQRKSVYIPHIMYQSRKGQVSSDEIRLKYGVSKQDFVFLIFGLIRPYKNIEGGIEAFRKLKLPGAKLIIAGNPVNSSYAREIKKLCEGSQDIILDLQYISNVLLDGLLGISDVVVLPYHDGSSMNSGVMIQAFSNGKPVISPDICMARDFAGKGFLYVYRKSLEKALQVAYGKGKELNREMGLKAQQYMEQWHNEETVSRLLYSMLE